MVRVSRENYWYLVGCFAPFLFKENGKLRIFYNKSELYVSTLTSIACYANRGFIDLPLFVSKKTGLALWDLDEWAKQIKPLFPNHGSTYYRWWWWLFDDEARLTAEAYLRALHMLSGTQFSNDNFLTAWEIFKVNMSDLAKEML